MPEDIIQEFKDLKLPWWLKLSVILGVIQAAASKTVPFLVGAYLIGNWALLPVWLTGSLTAIGAVGLLALSLVILGVIFSKTTLQDLTDLAEKAAAYLDAQRIRVSYAH